jgi:hypothetical protein
MCPINEDEEKAFWAPKPAPGPEKVVAECCEDCKTTEGVEHIPCPFNSDVNGDDTLHWLCGDCAHQRAMDV